MAQQIFESKFETSVKFCTTHCKITFWRVDCLILLSQRFLEVHFSPQVSSPKSPNGAPIVKGSISCIKWPRRLCLKIQEWRPQVTVCPFTVNKPKLLILYGDVVICQSEKKCILLIQQIETTLLSRLPITVKH